MKRFIYLIVFFILATIASFAQGYKVGDLAADFRLKNVDDKEISLSDLKDAKGYIVVFTCNHCPYSQAYENRLIGLDKKYKTKGYPVIAISSNSPALFPEDSFEKMKIRHREAGFTFPYLFDEGQKVYPTFGAIRTPHVFVLEKTKEGNVVRYIGAIDDNHEDASAVKKAYVANAVDALLAGKAVEVSFTKAIGCGIK